MRSFPSLKMPYLSSTTRQTRNGPWSHCTANLALCQPTTLNLVLLPPPCPHALVRYLNPPLSLNRIPNPSIHLRNNSQIQPQHWAASCNKGRDLPMLELLEMQLSSTPPKPQTRISPPHLSLNARYRRPCHRPRRSTRHAPQSLKLRLQASWHLPTLHQSRQVVASSQRRLVDIICTTSMR